MAYAVTAKQLFEALIKGTLAEAKALKTVGGVVEFDIKGDQGGTWLIDLSSGKLAKAGTTPQCIVRAQDRDFMALVEGRMSMSDGLITERLHVAGEAGHLARLMEVLQSVRREAR